MEYKENEILFDLEHKEVFYYQEEVDKFLVETLPERIRKATDEEAEKLKKSGKNAITIDNN